MSPVSWGDSFTLPLRGDRIMELRQLLCVGLGNILVCFSRANFDLLDRDGSISDVKPVWESCCASMGDGDVGAVRSAPCTGAEARSAPIALDTSAVSACPNDARLYGLSDRSRRSTRWNR